MFLSVECYILFPLHFIHAPHTYHRCYYMTKCEAVWFLSSFLSRLYFLHAGWDFGRFLTALYSHCIAWSLVHSRYSTTVCRVKKWFFKWVSFLKKKKEIKDINILKNTWYLLKVRKGIKRIFTMPSIKHIWLFFV